MLLIIQHIIRLKELEMFIEWLDKKYPDLQGIKNEVEHRK